MGRERNVNENLPLSPLPPRADDDTENKGFKNRSYSPMEQESNLLADEGANNALGNEASNNGGNDHSFGMGMAAAVAGAASAMMASSVYSRPVKPPIQPNQLAPSVSLTPISQTSGSSTPSQPTAKHNLPATALMTTSM